MTRLPRSFSLFPLPSPILLIFTLNSAGRRYRSPPPPISAASTSLAVPASAPPSPQKRTRPVTPPPSSSRAPSHVPNSSLRPVSSLTERFDDIDFDALAAAGLEDEIEDDDEEEPPTQYSTQGGSPSPSPSKKQKFTSFGGGVREPTTPTKPAGVSSSSSTFAAIQNDPDSPFHRIQRNLFGGGTDAEGDGASSASTLQPGSTPAPPSSSPSKPLPSSSATAADPSSSDLFTTLSASLLSLPSLLAAAQADHARTARLLAASKKKDETQRRVVEKMKKENEGLRRENEGLKERVRGLEEERNELRTRGR